MGVAEDFRAFRDRYLISKETMGSISYRFRRITKQLNKDFWNTDSETAHSLYVGSYVRDTAAKGVSDLDISFTLPNTFSHAPCLHEQWSVIASPSCAAIHHEDLSYYQRWR
jgi:tRNA nucleotidyltransferase (CCA-adding enzyme)